MSDKSGSMVDIYELQHLHWHGSGEKKYKSLDLVFVVGKIYYYACALINININDILYLETTNETNKIIIKREDLVRRLYS
jgi:hypothetical protein